MIHNDRRWEIVSRDGTVVGLVAAMTKEQAERACLYYALGVGVKTAARVIMRAGERMPTHYDLRPRRSTEEV